MSQIRIITSRGFEQEPVPEYTANLTISANTNNYDIRAACIAAGWNGTDVLHANLIINSGVWVGSVSTSTYAVDTNSSGSFPADSTIEITNNGTVIGRGGDGGDGSDAWAYSNNTDGGTTTNDGGTGGDALYCRDNTNITIELTNNGTLYGGGGGGGGGGYCTWASGGYGFACAASGGGAGAGGGSGGAVGTRTETASPISTWQHRNNASAGGASSYHAAGSAGSLTDFIQNYESTGKGSTWVSKARAGYGGAGGAPGSTGTKSTTKAYDWDASNTWANTDNGEAGIRGYSIKGTSNVTVLVAGTQTPGGYP